MNVLFQVALGFCPVIVALLIMTIVSIVKKNKNITSNVLFLVGSIVISVSFMAAGMVMSSSDGELSSDKEKEMNLELAYAVAAEGDYELASEMLESMRENSADSVELTECMAYLEAYAGNPETAKVLFAKANRIATIDNYEEAVEFCDKAIKASGNEADGESSTEATEKLQKFAKDRVKEISKESELDEMAEVLVEAQELYDDFLLNDNLDSSRASSLAKKIGSAYEENPDLESVEEIRVCRVKLLALANKYKEIVALLDDNSGFAELAIAAELYINDMVKENAFSEDYGEDYIKIAQAVAKQLEKSKEKVPAEEVKKLENIEQLIKSLNTAEKKPAIGRLKAEISKYANDETSPDRPKAYMQLARLEYKAGEDSVSELHITSALSTVGVSDDEAFSEPMAQIVDAITDKDDLEKVKQIAAFAAQVTDNSSDALVVKTIDEYYVPSDDYDDYDDYEEGEEGEEREEFEAFFANIASQKRNAFSISSVDATNFSKVQVVLNVDPSISVTPQELKNLITIKDCGVEITDYTVEKIDYKKANILLCCDVSGSMSGQPIMDLRTAVENFAATSSDAEDLALVTFEDWPMAVYPFGTSKEEIRQAGANLDSGGGTDIYGAVTSSIEMFEFSEDELNFILLMSDGASSAPSSEQLLQTVTTPCNNKDIVIYSLGLGSGVDSEHLNMYATATGGYFVYVADSATLDDFYAKLRNQILNRYIITYTAVDTLRTTRDVSVSTKDGADTGLLSDTKCYTMYGTHEDAVQTVAENDIFGLQGVVFSGLDTRCIYHSNRPVTVNLKGKDLTKEMSFDIKFDGKLDYGNIAYEVVDGSTLKLTLPGGMATGTYDLKVTYNGKTAIFKEELIIAQKGNSRYTEEEYDDSYDDSYADYY